MSLCAECNVQNAERNDYLCRRCRVAMDPKDWEDRLRVQRSVGEYLHDRAIMFYGLEIFFPEDSPWAWLRILDEPSLADPEAITGRPWEGLWVLATEYEKRSGLPLLVVWKATGDIYETVHGAVDEDSIWKFQEKALTSL